MKAAFLALGIAVYKKLKNSNRSKEGIVMKKVNMKDAKRSFGKGFIMFLSVLFVLSLAAIAAPITVYARTPNFNNTVFRAEGRVNIRSNLNGNHDGWFDYTSGDVRILSAGHFRGNIEYFRVRYPLFAGGHREGFARRSDILIGSPTPQEVTFRQNTTVFRQSNMRTNFGTVWGGNRGAGYAFTVGARGNNLQVIYRLDAGGHRMGWVPATSIINNTNTNTTAGLRFPLRGSMIHSSNARTNNILCDFNATLNTRIYAPANGTVIFRQAYTWLNNTRTLTSFGNWIEFRSACGRYNVRMAHLNSFNNVTLTIPATRTQIRSGSQGNIYLGTRQVRQGDLIGFAGATGNASGPHLHLELRINGTPSDPLRTFRTW